MTCSGLEPATSEQFAAELTACLALVAPVGMTEESRREWLSVAWQTLKHLPPDILASGCGAARMTCDHPSKIVPAITAETKDWMELRYANARSAPSQTALPSMRKRCVMDRRGQAMTDEDTNELNSILESLGATARYRPDGTKYTVAT